MNTPTATPELQAELEELYLTGEQWLDELTLADDEGILMLKHAPGMTVVENFENKCHKRAQLKQNIGIFMHKVRALILHDEDLFDLQLLEDINALRIAVAQVLEELGDIKLTLTGRTRAA